ncbi:hypothetical protein NFI96_018392, partial [Prochilodus magdalenae]
TNRTRHRLSRLPSLVTRNWISLGITGGLCAVPFVQDQVSHEALIRRASTLVTNSANTYLSQTTLALVETLAEYTNTIHTLITVHRSYVANINKLNPTQEDTIWQMIVSKRQEIIDRKKACEKFEEDWTTAVNLSKLAAEAAFNAVLQLTWVSVTTSTMVQDLDPTEVAQVVQLLKDGTSICAIATRYQDEILGPVVRPYAGAVGPGFLLVHNNARPHVARVCRQFLENEGIDTIDWPTGSPDLNPIEHLWDIMFRSIRRHQAALQTVQELSDALVQIWEEIPQDNIRADQPSAAAQTNLQMALSQVKQAQQRSREAERELEDSKAEDGERLQGALISATQEEEEDIPEAYQRED